MGWATRVAEAELRTALPRRWAHTRGVAERAVELGRVVGEDAALLVAAATLHDVGYSPQVAVTGFHPLDGARFLRDEHGADDRLVRLVANHSFALLEAEERGLSDELAEEFPLLGEPLLVDALIYCDMTTTPDGEQTAAGERVAEIRSRYGGASVPGGSSAGRRRRCPAVRRIEEASAAQPR
nr:HD domain-containing protein [Streptomyces acidiscabies]